MPMRIRVSEPRLLPDLLSHLLRNDCVAHPVNATTCAVEHLQASDYDEARVEMLFFLRAWQARHEAASAVLLG